MQAIDIEPGTQAASMDRPPSFRLRHPAVAYLSKLRSGRSEGSGGPTTDGHSRGPSKRRKTLHFMTGGLLGEAGPKERPSGCGSIQSSMMSETQRSLASLESMMSSASRLYRGSHLARSMVGTLQGPSLRLPSPGLKPAWMHHMVPFHLSNALMERGCSTLDGRILGQYQKAIPKGA